jgi:Homoserine acetyltransferase
LKVQDKTSKFYIPQLKLESGELLENVEIAYKTYGTLSEKGGQCRINFHALN